MRWRDLSPTRAVAGVLRRTLDFRGRSARAEFWWWEAFTLVSGVGVLLLAQWLEVPVTDGGDDWLFTAFEALILLPSVAVGMRRLHDVGLPGWPFPAFEVLALLPESVLQVGGWGVRSFWDEDYRGVATESAEVLGLAVPWWAATAVMVALVVLGALVLIAALLPSQRRSNRWGPPPGAVRQAEVFG